MSSLFSLLISPLGLPIRPIWEWVILSIVEAIAFRAAYNLVGEMDVDNSGIRTILHWLLRLIIFVAIWFVLNKGIWLVKLVIGLFS